MATFVNQQSDVMLPRTGSDHHALSAEVMVQCNAWSEFIDAEATIQRVVAVVDGVPEVQAKLDGQKASGLAVSIVLSDDEAVRQLNKTHRGIDKPTNVLSFPAAPGTLDAEEPSVAYLGDIVIAYETVVTEAKCQDRTVDDHFSHLVTHGLLHVLGYDHETEEDARKMEQLEISLLAMLGIADPYN